MQQKTAIVTGAGRGIGRGIALDLAQQGAQVVVVDLNMDDATNVAKEIETMGGKSRAIACDVSKKEEIDAVIAQTKEKFQKVDILVNNAGIYPAKMLDQLTEEDWEKVIHVNLRGSFQFAQAAAKEMTQGGKIVFISSIASIVGFPGLIHYCATKGGVNGMVRAMALELAAKKINVNAVAPGAIQTPGASGVMDPEVLKQTVSQIPWARIGQPEDIAHAVTFLASEGADYITGQVLVVDGGWTIH